MSLLKQLDSNTCKVGMRVQDHNGSCGTVQWVGKLDKNPPPPPDQPKNVTYAGVVFDEAKPYCPWRFDGTLNGVKLIDGAAPGSVAFLQPKKDLWEEVLPKCIAAMREQFGDKLKDWHDIEVSKFVIARKCDLKLTAEMITNHLKWRGEHGVKPTDFFPPRMAVGYPIGMQPGKHDYEGNLIRVERPGNGGKQHPKDFVSEHGLDRLMRWHTCSMEQARDKMKESGWKHQRLCFIIDLKDFGSVSTDVAKFGQGEGKIDQDNYPEMMGRAFVINAPWFFSGLWKVVRMFVDERTKDKFKILGDDYKKEMLKYMDESCLPSCAGGTNDGWLESSNGGMVGALLPPDEAAAAAAAAAEAEAEAMAAARAAAAASSGPPPGHRRKQSVEFRELEDQLEREQEEAERREAEYERRKAEEAARMEEEACASAANSPAGSVARDDFAKADEKGGSGSREGSKEKKAEEDK